MLAGVGIGALDGKTQRQFMLKIPTVVIPWPAHETFYTIVFALGGFGAGAWTVNGMLRGGR